MCQNSEWEKLGNGKFSTQETLIRMYKARKCFELSLYFSWLFCCYCNFKQTKDFDKKDSAILLSAKEFSSTGEQSDKMLIFQLCIIWRSGWAWHFKGNKDYTIAKFIWHDLRMVPESIEKGLIGAKLLLLLLFCPHKNGHFWPFPFLFLRSYGVAIIWRKKGPL